MVIVVVIAAILVALAVPNMSEFIKNNARATALNTLVATITYARSHAVSNNKPVTVCQSSSGTGCTNAVNFHQGLIVFVDEDGDGVLDGADGDRILRAVSPDVAADVTLIGASDLGTVTQIRFRGNGAASGVNAGTHIRYCDERGDSHARAVEVIPSGQSRLSEDSDGDGVHDVAGTDLDCTA